MRSQRLRRPSLRSACLIAARVAVTPIQAIGSGGNGTGLLWTIAVSVRSVSAPVEQVEHHVGAEAGGADAEPGVAGRVRDAS